MSIESFSHFTNLFKSRIMVIPAFTFPAFINLLIVFHLSPNFVQLLFTLMSVTLIAYAVYWYNDYTDIEVDSIDDSGDKMNRSKRPLISGRISKN